MYIVCNVILEQTLLEPQYILLQSVSQQSCYQGGLQAAMPPYAAPLSLVELEGERRKKKYVSSSPPIFALTFSHHQEVERDALSGCDITCNYRE